MNKVLFFSLLFILGIFNVFAGTTENIHSREYSFDLAALPKSKFNEAVILTDKFSYKLNETVVISGGGFNKFEQIQISVEQYDNHLKQNVLNGKWIIFADENGNFSSNWHNPSIKTNNNQFTIKAEAISASTQTFFTITANPAANLDQCANGGVGSTPIQCTGSAWQNGNLNSNQAHYLEGQSVPYRMKFSDLDTGINHSVTIEFDSTQSTKHAIDYLTSFDRTETTANPCSGVANCNLAGPFSTFPIPVDSNVTNGADGINGSSDDITQVSGNFTLFNGTITSVSGYTLGGSFAGNSQTSITINFTASTPNPVLAWSGHISTRADWGVNNSAIAISGSPYHMRLIDLDGAGGNQDRSLQNDAVIFPAQVIIIKDARPNTNQSFGFTSSGQVVSSFSLIDDGVNPTNTQQFSGLTSFGNANNIIVTENAPTNFYFLSSITCIEKSGGGINQNNTTTDVNLRRANIVLEEGEIVTCTFVNSLTTAAPASISGRVLNANAEGLAKVSVLIQNTRTLETKTAMTNSFGHYQFNDLTVGDLYVISVQNKKYTFTPNTQTVTLGSDVTNLDFLSAPD